jgi:hypothetical protein
MDVPFSFLTFWCHVAKRPSISGEFVSSFSVHLPGINFFCQTKVKDLHIPTDIEADVIRLKIPINNTAQKTRREVREYSEGVASTFTVFSLEQLTGERVGISTRKQYRKPLSNVQPKTPLVCCLSDRTSFCSGHPSFAFSTFVSVSA